MHAALRAGAVGYVVKSAVDRELLAAIRALARGRTFLRDSAASQRSAERARRRKHRLAPDHLSDREREVLKLVAEGYTNREAADELMISVKSVETYRGRVMEKLGLTTRADLVRFALECGFLAPGKCTV